MKLTEEQIRNLQQFDAHKKVETIDDNLVKCTLVLFVLAILWMVFVLSL